MKLKISVPKLHCERKTDLFGADEVYLALIVTAGKVNDFNSDADSTPTIVYSGLSPINEGFKKSTIKALNRGIYFLNIVHKGVILRKKVVKM